MGELTKRRWISLADGFDQLQPEPGKTAKAHADLVQLECPTAQPSPPEFFHQPPALSRRPASQVGCLPGAECGRKAPSGRQGRTQGARCCHRSASAAQRKLATIPAASTTQQNVANPPKILLPPPQPPVRQQTAPVTPAAPAAPVTPPPVQTAPVAVPQAAPVISLPPLGADNAPREQVIDRDKDGSVSHSHPDFPPSILRDQQGQQSLPPPWGASCHGAGAHFPYTPPAPPCPLVLTCSWLPGF